MDLKDRPRSINLENFSEEQLDELTLKISTKCSELMIAAKAECNAFLAPLGLSLLVKIQFAEKDAPAPSDFLPE